MRHRSPVRWMSWFQALDDNYDNTALVMRFKDYVTEIWVEWHLDLWNHFNQNGPRTINAAGEGTTSSKCVAYVPPNGFVFVEMLRKEQATANTASESVRSKKRKHRQLELDCRASRIGHGIECCSPSCLFRVKVGNICAWTTIIWYLWLWYNCFNYLTHHHTMHFGM